MLFPMQLYHFDAKSTICLDLISHGTANKKELYISRCGDMAARSHIHSSLIQGATIGDHYQSNSRPTFQPDTTPYNHCYHCLDDCVVDY